MCLCALKVCLVRVCDVWSQEEEDLYARRIAALRDQRQRASEALTRGEVGMNGSSQRISSADSIETLEEPSCATLGETTEA